jgi:hypothetical protein
MMVNTIKFPFYYVPKRKQVNIFNLSCIVEILFRNLTEIITFDK